MSKFPLFGLFTDIHLTQSNAKQKKELIKQISLNFESLNIEDIFIAGDIFDSRKAQPLESLNSFGEILKDLALRHSNINLIPGNHDKVDYESERSYLDEYEFHPNTNVIDKFYFCQVTKSDEFYIHLIPYFLEETKYIDYLNKSLEIVKKYPKKKHILITHIGIEGVINNDKKTVKSPIVRDLFKHFFKVFIGHYHDRQQVGKNIFYIGSTEPTNFGEDNEKGYMIFYSDGSHKYFPLNFKKYFTFEFDVNKEGVFEDIEIALKTYANHKHFIRFIFKGDLEKLRSIDEKRFEIVGIKVVKKRPDVDKGIVSAQKGEFVSFDKNSLIDNFGPFCELNNLTKDQIKLGEKYLKQKLEII